MRTLLCALSLMLVAMTATAVPAKKGTWKTIRLDDGTEVRAILVGDEHGHYWKAADGTAYAKNRSDAFYHTVDAKAVADRARTRRQTVNARRAKRLPKYGAASFTGVKKGLILLVNFSDVSFAASHDNALFMKIANEKNYTEGYFKGSMCDYFMAQSGGQFELDFDVVGPLTISRKCSYYGQNDEEDNDMHAAEMVIEAVNLAKNEVTDWKQYDWNNDGEVDQVYVVYAGMGAADGGSEDAIWPHAYDLTSAKFYGDGTGAVTVARGLKVNSYACGSELDGSNKICGIGTMCHEFSHCLGYPDFYDTDYSGGQGMDCWDLMDQGSYNGDGYVPAGYTSYERWVAGWAEPVRLEDEDVSVTNMKSLQESAESYVIYNKGQEDEYFLLENRQKKGWDAELPGAGLLIIHVDYKASVWEYNQPNDDPNHQRMTWMPADNKYDYAYYMGVKYYTSEGMRTDVYPYKSNNKFNKDSKPAAKLYNKNSDGTYFLGSSVENITQNADSTISFSFVANYGGGGDDPVKPGIEDAVFYESFDGCDGTGGNDGSWSGQVANGNFLTDNDGWTAEKAYGADQCAKFGTSSVAGKATTPVFTINGVAKLCFKAGAWNAKNDGTTLNISAEGATVSPATVTMEKGAFTDYEVTLEGTGSVRVTFEAEKLRFFLDEVVVKENETTGIREIVSKPAAAKGRIYTLDGRCVGSDAGSLSKGLYIIDGKKVMR